MDLLENEVLDTHTHVYLPEFEEDRHAMLSRALEAGVRRILLPAIDSETHKALFDLEKQFPETCVAMMGLHPCSVKENFEDELKIARNYLENRKFIGIGEIGLDFYWDLTFLSQQYEALRRQLAWALEFDLPFSLHSRNAIDECIKVTAEHQNGQLKGVFHCFSGDLGQAKKVIDLGFYLGIGGVVTFKNGGLDTVLPHIGLEHIVLETDAPYLAPVPFRGKRNEPGYLKYIVEKIAALLGLDEAEVRKKTTENVRKIFR